MKQIQDEHSHLVDNHWSGDKGRREEKIIGVAVDASDDYWGALIMREDGTIASTLDIHHWGEACKLHIFIKEVYALCRYIESLIAQGMKGRFVCVEDNTAAKHAVNRLYSTNEYANIALRHLASTLDTNQSSVLAIGIRSPDNVADTPSRNENWVEEKRRVATHAVFTEYFASRSYVSPEAEQQLLPGPTEDASHIRHLEGDAVPPSYEEGRKRDSSEGFLRWLRETEGSESNPKKIKN